MNKKGKRAVIKPNKQETQPPEHQVHSVLVLFMLLLMAAEWIILLIEQHWLQAFLVLLIIITLLSPVIFRQRMDIEIPAEFHILAVVFIFASLYLGEIQGFYGRFWWWDVLLHTTAGFLTGILGFLLVYMLNESKRVELYMTPGFIAFFAFVFAVAAGTFWELFEFAMDQLFGTQMQKPMLADPSGLMDTMWDMIVNALGAGFISITGWWYLKRKKHFFVKVWIRKFIKVNPGLFNK